jgi:hypothetical protein
VTFLATDAAGLGGLVGALSSTVTFLVAVTTSSSEGAIHLLVGAIGFVVTERG